MCNRWAQGVIRATSTLLREDHPEAYALAKARAEQETYRRVTKEETSREHTRA